MVNLLLRTVYVSNADLRQSSERRGPITTSLRNITRGTSQTHRLEKIRVSRATIAVSSRFKEVVIGQFASKICLDTRRANFPTDQIGTHMADAFGHQLGGQSKPVQLHRPCVFLSDPQESLLFSCSLRILLNTGLVSERNQFSSLPCVKNNSYVMFLFNYLS